MHIHILGICGTFMAGIASIAQQAGHKVTGSDKNVYPPMSDFLNALNIDVHQGYDAEQLKAYAADMYIVGNVMTRGHEVIEALLNEKLPFTSGPQWLAENVLRQQTVLAVAGTHGKTTTSSMLAWLLESHGLNPGFLIGGMPANFDVSARLGGGQYFVIEADEYDTAFFDKRSKFIHYRPQVALINNLEFDHADIFKSLDDIKRQFHHLIRCVPSQGSIIINQDDDNVLDLMQMGCWSKQIGFGQKENSHKANKQHDHIGHWQLSTTKAKTTIINDEKSLDVDEQSLPLGIHNKLNALAAMACAKQIGIDADLSLSYFKDYRLPKRRLENLLEIENLSVFRDFAHHPTAIKNTLNTLKQAMPERKLIGVIEMRSNSMKAGVHDEFMPASIADNDITLILAENQVQALRLQDLMGTKTSNQNCYIFDDSKQLYALLQTFVDEKQPTENNVNAQNIAFLTNGSFDGISEKLVAYLKSQ